MSATPARRGPVPSAPARSAATARLLSATTARSLPPATARPVPTTPARRTPAAPTRPAPIAPARRRPTAARALFTAAASLLATVVLTAQATEAGAAPAPKKVHLSAHLSGSQEVPKNTGDPDATGMALLTLHRNGRLCYALHVRHVTGDVTAAHIHEGLPGKDGPVAAGLTAPTWYGSAATCTYLGPKLTKRLRATPHRFYINIHSSQYPDGAVRGQLSYA
jgi:hypothetical protein